jgi:hypothetical protein
MPYYLSPLEPLIIGDKTFKRPRHGDIKDSNWILLGNNFALMWIPTDVSSDSLMKSIAIDKTSNLGNNRTVLNAFLADRIYTPQTTFLDAILDVLRVPKGQPWNALKPSRERSQNEIWLGPGGMGKNLFWSEPAVIPPSTKSCVDAFTRADGNLNGSTSSDGKFVWSEVIGTDWAVVSNQAKAYGSNADSDALADYALDTDDHYVQVDIVTFNVPVINPRELYLWISTRLTTYAAGTPGYYFFVLKTYGGSWTYHRAIHRYSDGAEIIADSGDSTSGTILLSSDGSSHTAKQNGVTVLGPSTDTTHVNSYKTGIGMYAYQNDNYVIIDNFAAGDLVTGLSIPVAMADYRQRRN